MEAEVEEEESYGPQPLCRLEVCILNAVCSSLETLNYIALRHKMGDYISTELALSLGERAGQHLLILFLI